MCIRDRVDTRHDEPVPTQPAATPPTAQFVARSAQTAGSFIGRFTACMNESERKAIVSGMTKEMVSSLTPEDLAKVRLAYKHAGERLKEHAATMAAFDDAAPPPSDYSDMPPEDEDVR